VTDDSLTIEAFNEIGPDPKRTDKNYTMHGMLQIQKSDSGNANITSSGVLHVVNCTKYGSEAALE